MRPKGRGRGRERAIDFEIRRWANAKRTGLLSPVLDVALQRLGKKSQRASLSGRGGLSIRVCLRARISAQGSSSRFRSGASSSAGRNLRDAKGGGERGGGRQAGRQADA